jgi:hypothetical protein
MAQYADALVAVWDGESRGTDHMIGEMQKLGKPVSVHLLSVHRELKRARPKPGSSQNSQPPRKTI